MWRQAKPQGFGDPGAWLRISSVVEPHALSKALRLVAIDGGPSFRGGHGPPACALLVSLSGV
eukprot:4201974-Pyramimonas_sp.AAC.1